MNGAAQPAPSASIDTTPRLGLRGGSSRERGDVGRVKPQFNVDARVNDFRVLVQDELDAVERYLASCCQASGVRLIDEVWEHLLESPGKRLRPLLLLLSARAHGGIAPHAIMAGAVVEMIHTATLIHDDVVDKARVRRGQSTVNHRWHDGIALMMGDFLYSKSFQLFTAAGLEREMEILADTTNRMSIAEMMQFQFHTKLDMREDEYMLLIGEKTAALIEASCALGAMLSGVDDAEPIRRYGRHVGLAFQITDDLFDYLGDPSVVGKPVGSDLREGKVTLPLIAALRNAPPAARERIEAGIRAGAVFDGGGWTQVNEFVKTHGGIEYALARAAAFGRIAKDALKPLPPSAERDALDAAVDFIISRCN
jgi:octaprenyl-diphosphate synthase